MMFVMSLKCVLFMSIIADFKLNSNDLGDEY